MPSSSLSSETTPDSGIFIPCYNYDAVGNLLPITRSTTSPSALAILSFTPAQGSVGQTLEGSSCSI